MSSTLNYIEFVCDQIKGSGTIKYRKMFGDYMIYVNEKPVLLVCDNIVYVKPFDCIADKIPETSKGIPYTGAKERYILNIDNADFAREIISMIEPLTPLPKKKKKQITVSPEK